MKIFETRTALHEEMQGLRQSGRSIGLVPTMGNLHAGHMALVAAAKDRCDYVLASIFVNPLQFGPGEDLDNYPRTLAQDYEQLAHNHCDGVFVPTVPEMYPDGMAGQTLVRVPGITERLCGASRPGHFDGVCTVVCKLFNLAGPDAAFFGEKDYQQLQVIRKMTADLCLPVRIHGVPTVRLPGGLALSSRNGYLDAAQLETAAALHESLRQAARRLGEGDTNHPAVELAASDFLVANGFRVDYFSVCHAGTLEPAAIDDTELVILAAAWLGRTRLIDNIRVDRRR